MNDIRPDAVVRSVACDAAADALDPRCDEPRGRGGDGGAGGLSLRRIRRRLLPLHLGHVLRLVRGIRQAGAARAGRARCGRDGAARMCWARSCACCIRRCRSSPRNCGTASAMASRCSLIRAPWPEAGRGAGCRGGARGTRLGGAADLRGALGAHRDERAARHADADPAAGRRAGDAGARPALDRRDPPAGARIGAGAAGGRDAEGRRRRWCWTRRRWCCRWPRPSTSPPNARGWAGARQGRGEAKKVEQKLDNADFVAARRRRWWRRTASGWLNPGRHRAAGGGAGADRRLRPARGKQGKGTSNDRMGQVEAAEPPHHGRAGAGAAPLATTTPWA